MVMLLQQPVHTLIGTTLAGKAVTNDVNAATIKLFAWYGKQKYWCISHL